MEFRILGPVELRGEHGTLTLGGRRERSLLAMLLLSANRPGAIDLLVDGLWGESPPPTAHTALHGAVSRLRKLLEDAGARDGRDVLTTVPGGYLLRVEDEQLDLARFEKLAGEGRDALAHGRADDAARLLRAALALWRGRALADLRYERFAEAEITRLDEHYLAAVEERIEADLALGGHAELVGELEALVREHPLRERLRAQLMLALYRSGRQADALAAYQLTREKLVDELGIEPSPQLRELNNRILRQDESLSVRPRTNIPLPATRLIGRAAALARLEELVLDPDVRLVTLTGVGGSGKTRLALELGSRVLSRFRDGAFFVPLAPISDAALVVPTIAQTLGVKELPGEHVAETLARSLGEKQLLLLVDNFEQVEPAANDLSFVVERTTGVTIVVTSRAALRVAAEHRFEVPPLAVPEPARLPSPDVLLENESVALFVERARAVNRSFAVTSESAGAIAEICVRVDGLPLAVELAAARANLLSPLTLLARLDDRFGLLSRGAHDRPARQRTLRATLDWSHDLLDEHDRTLFRRLSVFAGGCTLAAAERVCSADVGPPLSVIDGLDSLVEKSLLRGGDGRGEPRFTMLETVHEYARERLAESGEAHRLAAAHAAHFRELAERAYAQRLDDESGVAAILAADHDNLRRALAWLGDHDPPEYVQLAGALAWFWNARTYLGEGGEHLRRALAVRDAGPRHRARALAGAALVEIWQGTFDAAIEHLEEARVLWTQLGDTVENALTLDSLAYALTMSGHRDRARAAAAENLEVAQALGRPEQVDRAQVMLALTSVTEGDADGAERLARACLARAVERGDVRRQMEAYHLLGDCGLIRGDCDAAERHYATATRLAWELGDLAQAAVDLEGVAMAAAGQGEGERALRLGAAAMRAADELGVEMGAVDFWVSFRERYFPPVRAALRSEADSLAEEGRRLTLEQAVETATARILS